jgi:hypothetical protein
MIRYDKILYDMIRYDIQKVKIRLNREIEKNKKDTLRQSKAQSI